MKPRDEGWSSLFPEEKERRKFSKRESQDRLTLYSSLVLWKAVKVFMAEEDRILSRSQSNVGRKGSYVLASSPIFFSLKYLDKMCTKSTWFFCNLFISIFRFYTIMSLWHFYSCIWCILIISLSCPSPTFTDSFLSPTNFSSTLMTFWRLTHWF